MIFSLVEMIDDRDFVHDRECARDHFVRSGVLGQALRYASHVEGTMRNSVIVVLTAAALVTACGQSQQGPRASRGRLDLKARRAIRGRLVLLEPPVRKASKARPGHKEPKESKDHRARKASRGTRGRPVHPASLDRLVQRATRESQERTLKKARALPVREGYISSGKISARAPQTAAWLASRARRLPL